MMCIGLNIRLAEPGVKTMAYEAMRVVVVGTEQGDSLAVVLI